MTKTAANSASSNITGKTRVFMVAGDPVSQVQAPAIFNRVFQRYGVDAVLVPVQVSPDRFADFATTVLEAGNIDGLWLTIPHKPKLMPLLAKSDTASQMARSVNAVRRHADAVSGQRGIRPHEVRATIRRHRGSNPARSPYRCGLLPRWSPWNRPRRQFQPLPTDVATGWPLP